MGNEAKLKCYAVLEAKTVSLNEHKNLLSTSNLYLLLEH